MCLVVGYSKALQPTEPKSTQSNVEEDTSLPPIHFEGGSDCGVTRTCNGWSHHHMAADMARLAWRLTSRWIVRTHKTRKQSGVLRGSIH